MNYKDMDIFQRLILVKEALKKYEKRKMPKVWHRHEGYNSMSFILWQLWSTFRLQW